MNGDKIFKLFFIMPQKTHRKLKLQPEIRISSTDRRKKEVPSLKLCGVWMEKLGFKPGDMVSVTTRDQLLIIEPMQVHEPEPQEWKKHINKLQNEIKRLEQWK
jgi:toxic protein SymE